MMMMRTKMFNQPNCRTVVGHFRSNGKCFSFNGSLLFLLILVAGIAQPSFARPSQEEDLPPHFDVGNDFKHVNNSEERHRVKPVDGVPQESHPIIIYKEDFVSADYVVPRRYKDIAHRRRHNNNNKQNFTDVIIEEKHDKTLFDIIPEEPLIVPEDMEMHGQSHMKLVPLIKDFSTPNENENEEEVSSKKELQKRPKKFHRRVRRSTINGEHSLYKRNPYFRHVSKVLGEGPAQIQYVYVKHSVPGKKHNGLDIPVPGPRPVPTRGPAPGNEPISFENRVAADENDRVIFSGGRKTTPRTTEMPESIFRDPRPENFDFSFMNPQRATTARSPIFTRRPEAAQQEESIFRDPRPENFDFSFMNPQAQQTSLSSVKIPAPTGRPQRASTQAGISKCVWAIVNCCSSQNTDIQYACFEQNGCYGSFWGLNPCADNVRDNIVNLVADYYN